MIDQAPKNIGVDWRVSHLLPGAWEDELSGLVQYVNGKHPSLNKTERRQDMVHVYNDMLGFFQNVLYQKKQSELKERALHRAEYNMLFIPENSSLRIPHSTLTERAESFSTGFARYGAIAAIWHPDLGIALSHQTLATEEVLADYCARVCRALSRNPHLDELENFQLFTQKQINHCVGSAIENALIEYMRLWKKLNITPKDKTYMFIAADEHLFSPGSEKDPSIKKWMNEIGIGETLLLSDNEKDSAIKQWMNKKAVSYVTRPFLERFQVPLGNEFLLAPRSILNRSIAMATGVPHSDIRNQISILQLEEPKKVGSPSA